MKRFHLLIIIAVLLGTVPAGASAANSSLSRKNSFSKAAPLTLGQQKIKDQIDIQRATLPIKISDNMQFTDMVYDQKIPAVVMEYYITSNLIDDETMRNNTSSPAARQEILDNLIMNQLIASLCESMSDEGVGLSMKYVFPMADKTLTITFSAPELKSTLANRSNLDPREVALRAVKREIAGVKVPVDIGNGLTMTHIDIVNGYVVYVYDVDENQVSFSLLRKNVSANKEATWNSLTGDALIMAFFQNIYKAGLGLEYKYVGSKSDESCSMVFSNAYLKNHLGK